MWKQINPEMKDWWCNFFEPVAWKVVSSRAVKVGIVYKHDVKINKICEISLTKGKILETGGKGQICFF